MFGHDDKKDDAKPEDGLLNLFQTLRTNYIQATYRLLDNNADANAASATTFGERPLHLATEFGSNNQVELLLDAKADPNLSNARGFTPLQLALHHQRTKVVEHLLDAKANPDVLYKQLSPAEYTKNTEISKLLIKQLTDLNQQDSAALCLALVHDNFPVVVDARTNALEKAQSHEHKLTDNQPPALDATKLTEELMVNVVAAATFSYSKKITQDHVIYCGDESLLRISELSIVRLASVKGRLACVHIINSKTKTSEYQTVRAGKPESLPHVINALKATNRYLGHFQENDTIYIFDELTIGESLNTFFQKYIFDNLKHVFMNIISILIEINHLHAHGYVHHDIGGHTIVLNQPFMASLDNFSMAAQFDEPVASFDFSYDTAPFEARNGLYKKAAPSYDIYSLGVQFSELFTNLKEKGKVAIPDECTEFLARMKHTDPLQRPTAPQCLEFFLTVIHALDLDRHQNIRILNSMRRLPYLKMQAFLSTHCLDKKEFLAAPENTFLLRRIGITEEGVRYEYGAKVANLFETQGYLVHRFLEHEGDDLELYDKTGKQLFEKTLVVNQQTRKLELVQSRSTPRNIHLDIYASILACTRVAAPPHFKERSFMHGQEFKKDTADSADEKDITIQISAEIAFHPSDEKSAIIQKVSAPTATSKEDMILTFTELMNFHPLTWLIYSELEKQGYLYPLFISYPDMKNELQKKLAETNDPESVYKEIAIKDAFYRMLYAFHIIEENVQALIKFQGNTNNLQALLTLSYTKNEFLEFIKRSKWAPIIGISHFDKLWKLLEIGRDINQNELGFIQMFATLLWFGFAVKDNQFAWTEFNERIDYFNAQQTRYHFPRLNYSDITPAGLSIDCIHHIVTTDPNLQKSFRGLTTQEKLKEKRVNFFLAPSGPGSTLTQRGMMRTSNAPPSLMFFYDTTQKKILALNEEMREPTSRPVHSKYFPRMTVDHAHTTTDISHFQPTKNMADNKSPQQASTTQRIKLLLDTTTDDAPVVRKKIETPNTASATEHKADDAKPVRFSKEKSSTQPTWKALSVLAEGRFGIQLKSACEEKINAIKLFKKSEPQDVEGELSINEHLKDVPGVLAIQGSTTADLPEYYSHTLLTLYCNIGSFESWLKKRRRPLSEALFLHLKTQMTEILERIHAKDVAHCDFAFRNVLLCGSYEMPTVLVSDFGNSLWLPIPKDTDIRAPNDQKQFDNDINQLNGMIAKLESVKAKQGDQELFSLIDKKCGPSLWKRMHAAPAVKEEEKPDPTPRRRNSL